MRTWILGALLLFAGAALMGPSAFACGNCKSCKAAAEKKAVSKKVVATEKKAVAADKNEAANSECCEGCEGCKSCKKEVVKTEKKVEEKTGDVYVVAVTEMCCAGCGKTVAVKLKKVDGVVSVVVNTEKGTVTVTMKEGKTLDKAACEAALKGTDFGVTSCDKQEVKAEAKKEETAKEAAKECEGCGSKGCEGCGSKKKASN